MYAVNWNDESNEHGYAGSSFARGVAGHGGSSKYEIHIPFILSGPSFKKGWKNELPSSNVDIVPTLLYAHGLEIPSSMQGRVLKEVFAGNTENYAAPVKEVLETSVMHSWGSYQLMLSRTLYENHQYVDYTKVERVQKTAVK